MLKRMCYEDYVKMILDAYGGDAVKADADYMRLMPYNFAKKLGVIGVNNVEDLAVAWMTYANDNSINRY